MSTRTHVLPVIPTVAPLCLCSHNKGTGSVALGVSSCTFNIHIDHGYCTTTMSGKYRTPLNVSCPWFAETVDHTSSAVLWVCGRTARHFLPAKWNGCCYAGIIYTGTDVYPVVPRPDTQATGESRAKRSIETETNLDKIRKKYPDYHFLDPWSDPDTSIVYGIGSTTMLSAGVITVYTLKKMNTLAAEILMMHDSTADLQMSTVLLTQEQMAMRSVVLRNRQALDLLTAREGGVCKMLSGKCCFLIPNNHDNITSLIAHSREAIATIPQPPPPESWLDFNILGGVGNWFVTTIVPILVIIAITVFIVLPILRAMFNKMVRMVAPESNFQLPVMMATPISEEVYARGPAQIL